MANLVRVFNDNIHPLKTYFKGDEIYIEAKSYLIGKDGKPAVMDLYEANDFRGQYHPPQRDASGQPDPKSFKIIKLEPVEDSGYESKTGPDSHTCMLCKHASPSPEELEAHINVRHAEASRLSMPEVDEKRPRGRPAKSA